MHVYVCVSFTPERVYRLREQSEYSQQDLDARYDGHFARILVEPAEHRGGKIAIFRLQACELAKQLVRSFTKLRTTYRRFYAVLHRVQRVTNESIGIGELVSYLASKKIRRASRRGSR